MLYKVTITELLSRTVLIEASSKVDAYDKAVNRYKSEEIVLNSDDYIKTKYLVEQTWD